MVDLHLDGQEDAVDAAGNGASFGYYWLVKRMFDLVVVLALAPLAVCIVAFLAILVRRDGGPAFYRQPRIGFGGRTFMLWKLRTMVVDADRKLEERLSSDPEARIEWTRSQKLKADDRVTALGHYLRKYSLDELPQLINVFLGDMSLVGPRPIMPEQRALYTSSAYYRLRPGLTGMWQVGKRNECSFAERAAVDADYFQKMSFRTDIWILAKTPAVVVRGTGV